jgi:hypothetical protein
MAAREVAHVRESTHDSVTNIRSKACRFYWHFCDLDYVDANAISMKLIDPDRSMLLSLHRHHIEKERMIGGSPCVALIKGN